MWCLLWREGSGQGQRQCRGRNLSEHGLGIFVMGDLLAVSDVIGFVVAWGAASSIVESGDADDQVVKVFLEENGAILMFFVPLVDHLFEIFPWGVWAKLSSWYFTLCTRREYSVLKPILVSSCSFLRRLDIYRRIPYSQTGACWSFSSVSWVYWELGLTDLVVMAWMMAWTLTSLIWRRSPLRFNRCVFHTFAGSMHSRRSMTSFLVPIADPADMDACVKANSMSELVSYRSMKSL